MTANNSKLLSIQEILVIALACLVLFVGIVIEVFYGDWTDAIARSGALIVCIGIFFGISDFQTVDIARQYSSLNELFRKLKKLESIRLENDIVFTDNEIKEKIRGSTNYLKERAVSLFESKNRRAQYIDAGVAIAGTLIWGFGSLVCQCFISCN